MSWKRHHQSTIFVGWFFNVLESLKSCQLFLPWLGFSIYRDIYIYICIIHMYIYINVSAKWMSLIVIGGGCNTISLYKRWQFDTNKFPPNICPSQKETIFSRFTFSKIIFLISTQELRLLLVCWFFNVFVRPDSFAQCIWWTTFSKRIVSQRPNWGWVYVGNPVDFLA